MNIITLPLGPLETNCYVVFENAPGAPIWLQQLRCL